MAVSNSLLLDRLSGHIGKQIIFKKYGDKTIVSKFPDMSKRKFTPRQKQLQETMANANYRVRTILADEQLKAAAQLRLNVTSSKLYTALIKEYINNIWPTIEPPAEKEIKPRKKLR